MFALALPIAQGLIQFGIPLAKRLFGGSKSDKWFNLAEQAANGVASAIEAFKTIGDFEKNGHTPSDAELDAVLAESEALHNQIQS